MLLQLLLASLLALSFAHPTPTPDESSQKDLTPNTEATKASYDVKVEKKRTTNEKSYAANGNERYLEQQFDGKTNLPYVSDNWSYQPFIEYSQVSPYSKSVTKIAFGKEAVEALQKSKEPQQNTQNVLYLQPEIDKPIDNQLVPIQPEIQPELVYVDPTKPQQNVLYLPPQNHELYGTPQQHPEPPPGLQPPFVYYTQVPQVQGVPDPSQPQNENVLYITPQPNVFDPAFHYQNNVPLYQEQQLPQIQHQQQFQPNYYHTNHMYLVTHVQSQQKPEQNYNEPQVNDNHQNKQQDDGKNSANDNKTQNKNESKDSAGKSEDKKEHKHEEDDLLVETNTAKAIIEEYEKHYVKKHVDTKSDGQSGTTHNPYPSATTPQSVTQPAPPPSLSNQPIIVPDLDENNLDELYSTTQNTVKTVKTAATIYQATQPTIVVTPRPLLGTTFLAPITAGIQLQSVDNNKPSSKDSVVVEIQKSVPYYLGKYEFIQNEVPQQSPNKNEEIKQNVDLGESLLKYSIERLPNPQALIAEYNHFNQVPQGTQQHKNNQGNKVNQTLPFLTQITYATQHDQEPEGGHYEYKIQEAPYPQQLLVNLPNDAIKQEKNQKPFPILIQPEPQTQFQQEPQPQYQQQLQILPIKAQTLTDYIQKPQTIAPQHYLQIPPIIPQKQHANGAPILLDPYPQVTKLLPQYIPLKMHQEVQKAPMKSYSYAPSYQGQHHQKQKAHGHHHHHQQHHTSYPHLQHNYQIVHPHSKKQKSIPLTYPTTGNKLQYHTIRLNDYFRSKPPVTTSNNPSQIILQTSNNPPFKASQQLQTVQEHLPPTQLSAQQIRKYRNPRHSFESSNIRLEYGFMPPLIPSIEIDENGKPITKNEE